MPHYIPADTAAADLLKVADRIMVIGCSGGGKSSLSQKLCAYLDLPYISMDRDFFWLPGWIKRAKPEERRLISDAVALDRWLMDGSGPSTFDLRVPRTHLVLWVKRSRWACLWGVAKRGIRYIGRTRPDMAPGCVERFPDIEFLRYIWTFDRTFAPRIAGELELHGPDIPVLVLKSRKDMQRLLDLVGVPA
ncbi:AAA family ATPase [Rhizobium sp. CECT 9324]|uniref:AAA family ATPase n=1 Tax=Rhizobium sp. CECT 9324 TaxID=2845820 RepID=UPI001E58FFB0|nr:AAA family ATPase [Rhizobium sp. CECT 9324]CAH0340689.1 hypothetical protein RHI9324_02369 [Rhizobium sp. CECT 9324]